MRGVRAILALWALSVLAACGSSSLLTAYQLRNVDFQTTQADALRVAVVVPARYRPRSNDVSLDANVRMGPDADAEVQRFKMHLSPAPTGPDEQQVMAGVAEEQSFYAYRIAPEDLAQFELFRRAVTIAKAQDGGGSLGVSTPVCRNGPPVDASVPVTSYLRTAETGSYVLLARIADLRTEATAGDLETLLPPCES